GPRTRFSHDSTTGNHEPGRGVERATWATWGAGWRCLVARGRCPVSGTWTRKHQRAHLRSIASKGGQARQAKDRAAKAPVPPYGGSFLDFLDAVDRGGPTRAAWRVFWKVADGLPLDPAELPVFQLHTGRTTPPTSPAREGW